MTENFEEMNTDLVIDAEALNETINEGDYDEMQRAFAEKPIGVYVKVNEDGFIVDVNSDIFIDNFEGWQKIDEGFGDKFAHAQNYYFDRPLVDENGVYQIKFNG